MYVLKPIYCVKNNGINLEFFSGSDCNEIRFMFAEHGSGIETIKVMFTDFTVLNQALKELVKRTLITEKDSDEYETTVISEMLNRDPELKVKVEVTVLMLKTFKELSSAGQNGVIKNIAAKYPEIAEYLKGIMQERGVSNAVN